MTLQEIVYDIITVAKKGNYTDDDALEERFLQYKIHEKRAKEIRDTFNRTRILDPSWIQDMGIIDLIEVNRADENDRDSSGLDAFSHLDCKVGRFTLPPVVSFHNKTTNVGNLGVVSVRSVSAKSQYHYMSYNQAMSIEKLSDNFPLKKVKTYTRLGDVYYVLDNPEKLRIALVLENPLQGYVSDSGTKLTGELVVGDSYIVYDKQIVHNNAVVPPNSVFVAVAATYTGPGTVRRENAKRLMTELDNYPMPNTMAERIIMGILTQELKIELSTITDVRNDSKDSLKVLQPVND